MKGYGKFVIGVYVGIYLHAAYRGLLESLFSSSASDDYFDHYGARHLSHSNNPEDFLLRPSLATINHTTRQDVTVVGAQKKETDLEFQQDKLVLAMIAFGNATRGTHVQRVIRSARTRGEWKGQIAIITDSKDAYTEIAKEDPLVSILHPRQEDWEDLPDFNHTKMKIKRFKTKLIDYILDDSRLKDMEFILYLDIDIVLCQPLVPWLREKWNNGAKERQSAIDDGMSTMYMFSEGENKGLAGHSGLILLHRQLSRGCLLKWRELFDRYRMSAPRDQWLVRKIRRAPERTKCRIKAWWPHPNDFLFPEPKHLQMRSFPQFMHITNTYRAQWIDSDLQRAFLEDALRLTDEERKRPNSLALVPENF